LKTAASNRAFSTGIRYPAKDARPGSPQGTGWRSDDNTALQWRITEQLLAGIQWFSEIRLFAAELRHAGGGKMGP